MRKVFAAMILGAALIPTSQCGAALIANWTLWATDYTGGGNPNDVVGNHFFTNGFNAPKGFGGNVNPADPALPGYSSLFNNNGTPEGGFYGVNNAAALPTSEFVINLWAYTLFDGPGVIFATNANNPGSIQIGTLGGSYVAYIVNGSNLSGTLIGSVPYVQATSNELTVVNTGGETSFYVDDVLLGSTLTPVSGGFGSVHLAVGPGGNSYYAGALADITVSTVIPEPASAGLLGLGLGTLAARRRRA